MWQRQTCRELAQRQAQRTPNNAELSIDASPVSPEQLGLLITRIDDDTLSSKTAKELFKALWASTDVEASVDALIEQLGLKQMSDDGELTAIVTQVLADNPDQVAELKSGKDKVLGFLVGQVMKATGGKANPKQVNELIAQPVSSGNDATGRGNPPRPTHRAAVWPRVAFMHHGITPSVLMNKSLSQCVNVEIGSTVSTGAFM